MVYSTKQIVRDVKVCLDRNMDSEQLFIDNDIDTLSLEDIIKSKIVESVRVVHTAAPYFLLEQGHTFGDNIYWMELESGYTLLPHDFMRLVSFQMSDWDKPVYQAISPIDAEYSKQRQKIKALRGVAQRPVCAIVTREEGLALEFYSCKSEDAYVVNAQYIPYPRIDKNGGVDISERCYTAVLYTISALTLTALSEIDKSNVFTELAKQTLQ